MPKPQWKPWRLWPALPAGKDREKNDRNFYIIADPDGVAVPDDLGRGLAGSVQKALYHRTEGGHSQTGCGFIRGYTRCV